MLYLLFRLTVHLFFSGTNATLLIDVAFNEILMSNQCAYNMWHISSKLYSYLQGKYRNLWIVLVLDAIQWRNTWIGSKIWMLSQWLRIYGVTLQSGNQSKEGDWYILTRRYSTYKPHYVWQNQIKSMWHIM